MIAVSTSVDPTISSSTAMPLLAEPPAAHLAATAAMATNSDEAERGHQRDRVAGRGRRVGFGRLAVEPEAGAPGDDQRRQDDDRERDEHAGREDADQQQDAQVHDRRRKRDSGIFGAALALAAEALGERLGDRGRAVGAADQRGGDGPVALAEDAVGDIAEEREAGDQHDHQPQFLRVPRAERAVMAVGQERQDRAGDDRIARERLHIVLVELVERSRAARPSARAAG